MENAALERRRTGPRDTGTHLFPDKWVPGFVELTSLVLQVRAFPR